jgi:signal peptidase
MFQHSTTTSEEAATAVSSDDVVASERPETPARSKKRIVATGLAWTLLALVAIARVGGRAEGFRPLAIRSGSMIPTFQVGDLALTRTTPAAEIKVGDIVSFHDVALGDQLVTHRVVKLQRSGNELDVETKGDANTVPEKWSVDARSSLGRTVFVIPMIGRWLFQPQRYIAVGAVLGAVLTFGFLLIRALLRVAPDERDPNLPAPGRHRRVTTARAS